MNTPRLPGRGQEPTTDVVGQLIGLAGARPTPEPALEESVRVAVHQAWRREVTRRRAVRARRRWLAAGVSALAIAAAWLGLRHGPGPPSVFAGTVVGTRGPVRLTPLPAHALVAAGDPLAVGTRIETGDGGAMLLSVGETALRVGPDTVLGLERLGLVRLLRGRLYVDSGRTPGANALRVATAFGSLMHRGTQYQVELQPGKYLCARVREGQVQWESLGRTQAIGRGEGLRVDRAGAVTRLIVPPYDPDWQWVSDFVPQFSIDGQSLSTFLDWFARETGRTLSFTSPATRLATDHTTLSGNISGLTPVQALEAVVATTRFNYDMSVAGEIRVGVRTDRGDGGVIINRDVKPPAATGPPSY